MSPGADEQMRAAFPRGVWLDLRTKESDLDDAVQGASWGEERTVHAEVLAALLLGAFAPVSGRFPAARIRGAKIVGRLDLMGAVISYPLICENCWFEQQPRFVETSTKTVRIITSRMPSFNGPRMWTDGLFNLYGSTIDGLLRLDRAHVVGEITLQAAHVGNGAGEAIAAESLTVDGDFACTKGFTAHGSINLRAARIAGRLSFDGAVLDARQSHLEERSGLHLSLVQAAELDLRADQPIIGGIRLSNARVGTLDDDPAVWPHRIWLNGFSYDYIQTRRSNRVPVAERLDWLGKDTLGYRPQPYEQLAAFYRRTGHDEDARRVLLAKQRHRRTTLRPAGRLLGRILDWTVGYGYRPWLAAIWLAALLTAGTVIFAVNRPDQLAHASAPPFNPFIYTLDLLIPTGAFGLRHAYVANGAASGSPTR